MANTSIKMGRLELAALATFLFVAFSYIVSATFLDINGTHVFRQSDVYAHILGFVGGRGLSEFASWESEHKTVYDIPIYQFIIAKLSVFMQADSLVTTRFFNLFLWLVTAFFGYRFSRLWGGVSAGVIFVFLLSTSPLILHYYSVPLPDVMAVAFSLAGIALLYGRDSNWRANLYALPFLSMATLMKSPIPFVFLVFFLTYTVLTMNFNSLSARVFLRKYVPLGGMLVVLLCLALLAEKLRFVLLSRESAMFFESPSRYFGNWEDRTSFFLWGTMGYRLNSAGPFAFGYIYVVVVLLALFLNREKKHWVVTLSANAAFFAGWMTFPRLYKAHDYYNLPGMVIIFISFAVSSTIILSWLVRKITPKTRKYMEMAGVGSLILLAPYLVIFGDSLSERKRTSLYSGIEYALSRQNIFLYVSNDVRYNPTMGGRVSTRFKRVSSDEFEGNCGDYLARYSAILSEGYSPCLIKNKALANYFIEDGGLVFLSNADRNIFTANREVGIKYDFDIIKRSSPLIEAKFNIYLEDNRLIYVKENCKKEDVGGLFFIQITPDDKTLLSHDHKKNVETIAFKFKKYGKVMDGICIATRDLPFYKISMIKVGQHLPGRTNMREAILRSFLGPEKIKHFPGQIIWEEIIHFRN